MGDVGRDWLLPLCVAAVVSCGGGGGSGPRDGGEDGNVTADTAAPGDGTVGESDATATFPATTSPMVIGKLSVPNISGRTSMTTVQLTASRTFSDSPVPGRLIVTWQEGVARRLPGAAQVPELKSYVLRPGNDIGPDMATVEVIDAAAPDRMLSAAETVSVAQALSRASPLRMVEVDRIRRRRLVPNDARLLESWALRHVNVPGAWDISSGSAGVVIAVLDDGVKAHPDLEGQLLPGWDMIADLSTAMDGDGRDPDPSPVPHTEKDKSSPWHGEHVAGIIAAVADNHAGIAGVAAGCKILPVRVLGREGASLASDTIAGLYWAAGLAVPGVPTNAHPAQVINLSLGGTGTSSAEEKAVADVLATGAVIVAAAGNDARDVEGTSWGSYKGVIAVGAVDHQGRRSIYSNFGPRIDVMAPGGDMGADLDGDGQLDGILSTWFDAEGVQPQYQLQQGTSMAAPYVSGIVALMKSVNPGLDAPSVTQILRDTAVPSSRCAEGCGAGLVDAAAALMIARGARDWNQAPALEAGADRLHLPGGTGSFAVFNAGGLSLTFAVSFGDAAGLIATPSSGSIPAKGGAAIALRSTGAQGDGAHVAMMTIASNGGTRSIPVSFVTGTQKAVDAGPVWVYLYDGTADGQKGGRSPVFANTAYTFVIRSRPGSWYLGAGLDANHDSTLNAGDWWTLYPSVAAPTTLNVPDGNQSAVLGPYDLALQPYR